MAHRVYHWKHGWIPLTHAAALSKAHGSHTGAARILGKLHPVAQEHLPRHSHVIAGHGGDGHFTILDTKTKRTTRLPESAASTLHGNGQTITGVDEHGNVKATAPAHSNVWQEISPADAIGPATPAAQEAADRHRALGGHGLTAADKARSKVKRAYRHRDGHTVIIESTLSRARATTLLDSVHHITQQAGADLHEPVTFHVPTGDRQFSSGRTLAYVRRGQRTVFISPKIASGDAEQPKDTPHFMPAHNGTTTQRYTIAHEVGHIVDGTHNHTPRTVGGTSQHKTPDQQHFLDHSGALSKYGRTNPAEGYAEVYAQWLLGERTKTEMAYARRYGWKS